MKKNTKILFIILCFSFLSYFNYDFLKLKLTDKYYFIQKSDSDDLYQNLLLVKKYETEKEFDELFLYLLSNQNIDLLSKRIAIRYINENNLTKYLELLKKIKSHYQNFPKDSSWNYKVSENEFRSYKIGNSYLVLYLNQTINEFETR